MKIAIIGYYGHNNLGDELNLHEVIKLLYQQYPGSQLDVFSGGLSHVFNIPSYNLIMADKLGLTGYREILNTYDLIVVGGGGIVFLGANYFNFLMEGITTPYIFSRIGIDNRVISEKVCREFKHIFKNAQDVTVRTQMDRDFAQRYLKLSFDVVPEAIWNYKAQKEKFPFLNTSINVSTNGYVSEELLRKLSISLDEVSSNIVITSMQDTSLDFYHNVKATPSKRFIIPDTVGIHRKAGYLSSSNLVIASRLHALLIALSHGVPVFALKSTPKIQALMNELHLQNYFIDEELPAEFIDETVYNTLLKSQIINSVNELKKLSIQNIIR